MAETITLLSESTLTDRYQTTIPDPVRKVLGLGKRDKIQYTIQPNGRVIISRADKTQDDPILGQFISFLAQDIERNPQHIRVISEDLVNRVQSLVAGIEIDLDAPLVDKDE